MVDRIRVVHVDDDPDVRAVTAERLGQVDDRIDVTAVSTPEEALDLLNEESVDCVLADYRLSEADGLGLLADVRDRWPDLPFILYTAKGSEEVASKAISKGVTDYVRKATAGGDYERLAQRIIAATEHRRASEYARVADLVREIQADLVKARTRAEIETGVCEQLVDVEPYVFAWIGTVDTTRDHVERRATAGREDGYLDAIEIPVDGGASERGPTRKAIETRTTQVIADVESNPAYEPWREAALERGYRSSAAIPIEYEGTLYGVLNVYADYPGAFDADERTLLGDLSQAIAHAYYRVDIKEQYESQYQELFENAPVMMAFTRDEDGEPVIEACNQQFADKLGYPREEITERPLADLYTEESAERLLKKGGYRRGLDGEFTVEEREFVTADGEQLVALLQASPRRNDEGDVVGTHALYVDITDRKRAQSVLEQAKAMEASMDGMSILDENDGFVYANQAHADIYGYDDPEAVIGNTWRMLYEDDEIEWFEEEILPDIEETGEWRGEATGLRADGTTFPQELSVTRLDDGSWVSVVRDITERKERERELAELRREFETVFENVQDALYLLDVDDEGTIRFQRFNEHEEEFTGKATEDVRGKTPIEAFGDELGSEIEANYRECIDRKEAIVYEEELPVGGETTVWQTKLTPIVVDGTVEQIVGSGREITELRQRERELERKNDLFEQAQEIADLGAWETDLQANEGWWTEQVNQIYGLPQGYEPDPGEGIGYYHPADRDTIREAYQMAVEDGEPYDLEVRIVAENGTTRWVRTLGEPIYEDGEIVRVRGTIQDITAHKEREAALENARERLRVLFDESPDAITIHDADGEILDVNKNATEYLGYSREELLLMNVAEFETEHTTEELRELWTGIETGNKIELETNHERKDGSTYPAEVWLTRIEIHDEDRYLSLARDITQRKEYEKRLEEQRDNLEILNQVVRHDIRNDMTVIHGRANLLEAHVEEDGLDDLRSVQEATENAIELTKTARDLSETMLSTEEDVEPVSLKHHLVTPVENARSAFESAVITLEDKPPDVRVWGNDLLEAVFRNLVQNAIVHNDKTAPRVRISTTEDEEMVTVSVADNGPGIPDEQKETIFGKGEKGIDSPGTGLGLYLVETLVNRYGGAVHVEDNDPEGSIFIVELPIVEA
jgi:PAS domain S-box-containing protein